MNGTSIHSIGKDQSTETLAQDSRKQPLCGSDGDTAAPTVLTSCSSASSLTASGSRSIPLNSKTSGHVRIKQLRENSIQGTQSLPCSPKVFRNGSTTLSIGVPTTTSFPASQPVLGVASDELLLNFECEFLEIHRDQTKSNKLNSGLDRALSPPSSGFLNDCYCFRQSSKELKDEDDQYPQGKERTQRTSNQGSSASVRSSSLISCKSSDIDSVVSVVKIPKKARERTSTALKSLGCHPTGLSRIIKPYITPYSQNSRPPDVVHSDPRWDTSVQLLALFNPLSNAVGKILHMKEKVEKDLIAVKFSRSWQDKLLYRARAYISDEVRNICSKVIYQGAPDSDLVNSKDFRSFQFYKRMIEGFEDNWISPKVLVLSNPIDKSRHSQPCIFSPSGFIIPPFHLSACRVSPDALKTFIHLISRSSPTRSAALATRARSNDPCDSNCIPISERTASYWPPTLLSLLAHNTRDVFNPRTPREWIVPTFTRTYLQDEARKVTPFPFFTMPWKGRCRLVIQRSFSTQKKTYRNGESTSDSNAALTNMLTSAAFRDQLLAISSDPINDPKLRPQVLLLFGGKDMLALDWLPFVSRMLHNFITRKAAISAGSNSNESSVLATFKTVLVLPEYPGYGFSVGLASPETCLDSALISLNRVAENYHGTIGNPLDLHIIGYSLGAGVALNCIQALMANRQSYFRIKSLNLIAAPTSVSACAAHMLKVPETFQPFITSLLAKFETASTAWNNEDNLLQIIRNILDDPERYRSLKISVLHGELDEMVSSELSRRMVDQCRELLLEGLREARCVDVNKDSTSLIALQEVLQNIKFHLIPGATHLSIAADPSHQNVVYETLFDPSFIELK